MKRLALILALSTIAFHPAAAEEADSDEGFSLMEEGAKLFLRGFAREMEPALENLRGFAEDMQPAMREFMQEMGPAFAELLGKIDDLSAYHPPEVMPNGDIIMRRKTPPELADEPKDEIEI